MNSDITNPKLLNQADRCKALCKFVTGTQTKNQTDYQPKTLRDIVTAIQMHLHSNKVYWKIIPKEGGHFEDLFYVVDHLMKERVAKGMGVIQSRYKYYGR